MSDFFSFPNPVNELAARTVAAGVALLSVVTVLASLADNASLWLTGVLAAGFIARVLTGPTMSPFGQLATRVIAPRLGPPRLVAGPPKRFAQGIGATLSVAAVIAHFGFGAEGLTQLLLLAIVVAAILESVFALCLGCKIFGVLMRLGVIPAETCEACANVALRQPATQRL